MRKLELIYKCCTGEIQKHLDDFWKCRDIPEKKLIIDVDNLQSIIIYLLANLYQSNPMKPILVHLAIIDNFLPDAVSQCNRAFYLAMMQSSSQFIINQHEKVQEKLKQ